MQIGTSVHVLQIYEERLVELEISMFSSFVVFIEFELGIPQMNQSLFFRRNRSFLLSSRIME